MKKFIAILLALTMVFALAACGEKTPEKKPNTDTPGTTVTDPTQETVDVAAKQAFYDTYFTSDAFKPAGNSMKAYSDSLSMSQVMDAEGYGMLEIAVLDNFVRIYRTQNGVYLHTKMLEEGAEAPEEAWLKYTEAEGENTLTDNDMMGDSTPELGEIKKVTYVETKDGLDYVTVEVANEEYVEGTKYTEYTLKLSYEEKEYTVTLYEVTAEGSYMATWNSEEELPEGLELSDYKLDVENSNLVHEEDATKSLTCTIVDTKDVTPAATMTFDMYIDAKTHGLVKMGGEEAGVYTTLEYFNTEKYEADVAFPSEVAECTAEELGMIIFAMLLMSVQP